MPIVEKSLEPTLLHSHPLLSVTQRGKEGYPLYHLLNALSWLPKASQLHGQNDLALSMTQPFSQCQGRLALLKVSLQDAAAQCPRVTLQELAKQLLCTEVTDRRSTDVTMLYLNMVLGHSQVQYSSAVRCA
jgi:hypothetical protein